MQSCYIVAIILESCMLLRLIKVSDYNSELEQNLVE